MSGANDESDGTVNVADVYRLRTALAGLQSPLEGTKLEAADVYADGKVNLIDAMYMLRFAACLTERLPIA